MNTYEKEYCSNLALPVGADTDGPTVTFGVSDIPGCVGMFIAYTKGNVGDSLAIQLQVGKQTGGDVFYDSGASITVTTSGFHNISLPGKPTLFKLVFTPSGPGATDHVSVILSGLPTGTVIT